MPLTNGSGYGSGSCYFRHWPSRCQQKTVFKNVFLIITFWRYIYIIFQRYKVKKKSQSSRNQDFSYYFCLVIEGYGFGSRRPKNIRIRNTAFYITSNIVYKFNKKTAKRTASVWGRRGQPLSKGEEDSLCLRAKRTAEGKEDSLCLRAKRTASVWRRKEQPLPKGEEDSLCLKAKRTASA